MSSFGKSRSKSSSQSQSTSSSGTFIDPNQAPFLDFLRQQGQDVAAGQIPAIGSVADQLSGRLGGIGGDLLGGIQGQAGAFGPGVGQGIGQLLGLGSSPLFGQAAGAAGGALPGQDTLGAIAGGGGGGLLDFQQLLEPGAQLGGQLSALDQAIQRNLSSSLGTLGGSATLAGQSGGDREAFFASELGGEAGRSFASGASNLLASDLASRRQLGGVASQLALGQQGNQLGAGQALQAGGIAQGGLLQSLLGIQAGAAQGAGGLGLGQQGVNVQAGLGGIDSLGGLFNLGLAPFGAQFSPLQSLASILGDPTVLGASQGQSTASSKGKSSAVSVGFGGG
jgi:hypothetical protein